MLERSRICFRIGSINIRINTASKMSTNTQPQKQNAQDFRAFSLFPSPNDLEITEVPPIPNNVPRDIKIRYTGVAKDTAATNKAVMCLTDKKGISKIIYKYHQHSSHRRQCIFHYRFWDGHTAEHLQIFIVFHENISSLLNLLLCDTIGI